jgi:uncharacterized protein
MTKITLDASFQPTSRTTTPEGYLCVKGIAAKTGVYQYLASELGLDGPERMVGVYRPPEQVFSESSMATYSDKDVTNDHPGDLVNSSTFKEHSVGHVRGVSRDGENIIVDMIIKDQEAIDDINSGKSELSPGYLAEYVKKSGVANGEPYEFEQHDIVINHVAVVEAARAGKEARIFDSKPKGVTTMAQRKVVLDSKRKLSVTLDEDAAAVVEEAISALNEVAEEAEKRADEAEAKADDLVEKLAAASEEGEKMKEATSDSALAAKLSGLLATIDSAKKIMPSFDAKGVVSQLEIKRAVMAAKKPGRAWADKSAAYVEAAFDAEADMVEEEDKDDKKKSEDAQADLKKLTDNAAAFRDARQTLDGTKSYIDFLKGKK